MFEDKVSREEAMDALKDAVKFKGRADKATKEYNRLRQMIASYMQRKKITEFSVEPYSEDIITAKLVERVTSLVYDTEKLKGSLDPDQYSEVVDKVYTITDIDKMISLLKSAGVSAKEFKSLISIAEVPNKAKIQQLFSVGDITMKQLEGTFTATISKSVQISQKAVGKGDND